MQAILSPLVTGQILDHRVFPCESASSSAATGAVPTGSNPSGQCCLPFVTSTTRGAYSLTLDGASASVTGVASAVGQLNEMVNTSKAIRNTATVGTTRGLTQIPLRSGGERECNSPEQQKTECRPI